MVAATYPCGVKTVSVVRVVEGPGIEVEQLWYDRSRWASWLDGFASLQKLEGRLAAGRLAARVGHARGRPRDDHGAGDGLHRRRRADARVRGRAGARRAAGPSSRPTASRTRITVTFSFETKATLASGAQVVAAAAAAARLGALARALLVRARRRARSIASGGMFVFKAAVVGTGDAAREIAAAIEAAGVEVVLIDGVSFDGLGDVDLVIEAMPERMEVKHRVFAELDAPPRPRDPRDHHGRPLDHRDRRDHAAAGEGRRPALRRPARGRGRRER